MKRKRHHYMFTLIIVAVLNLKLPVHADSPISAINPAERCKSEDNYRCAGQCKDGWSIHCYYDGSHFKIQSGLAIELQKDKCFGLYHESTCEPCKRVYQLSSDTGLKEVTCNEFYSRLISKDQECARCLKYDFAAGG